MISNKMFNWLKRKYRSVGFRNTPQKILFYRNYVEYSGGHQKVYDYFRHLQHHASFTPEIIFSKNSVLDDSNPWYPVRREWVKPYQPHKYSFLFVAGMDWQLLGHGVGENCTVINLIQHIRHANPRNPLFQYLTRKAIRIAVSPEVKDAIIDTGCVNGPVYTISNGHTMPVLTPDKEYDIYILGKKNPEFAKALYDRLVRCKVRVLCTSTLIPREDVFSNMAKSRITVLLPDPLAAEGFYLPALEAMKYCDITLVPDCVGNRSFCSDRVNCLMPDYTIESFNHRCIQALNLLGDPVPLQAMKIQAKKTVTAHGILRERQDFYTLLEKLHFTQK